MSGHGGEENDPAVVLGGASNCGPHVIALHTHYLVVLFAGCEDFRRAHKPVRHFGT